MLVLRDAGGKFGDQQDDDQGRKLEGFYAPFEAFEMGHQSYEFPDPKVSYIRAEVLQSALPLVRQINALVEREGGEKLEELFKCCVGEGLPYGGVRFEDFDALIMEMVYNNPELIDELNLIRFKMMLAAHYLIEMRSFRVRDYQDGERTYFEMRDRFNVCPTVSFYKEWLHKCSSKVERMQVYKYLCDADVGNRILFFNEWLRLCESLGEFRSVFGIMSEEKVSTDANTFYSIKHSSLPESKYWKLLKQLDEIIAENANAYDSWWMILRKDLDNFRCGRSDLN